MLGAVVANTWSISNFHCNLLRLLLAIRLDLYDDRCVKRDQYAVSFHRAIPVLTAIAADFELGEGLLGVGDQIGLAVALSREPIFVAGADLSALLIARLDAQKAMLDRDVLDVAAVEAAALEGCINHLASKSTKPYIPLLGDGQALLKFVAH